ARHREFAVRSDAMPGDTHYLEFVAITPHRAFIPFDADTGNVRNLEVAVLDSKGLLQNGIGPIVPFQPMGRPGSGRRRPLHCVSDSVRDTNAKGRAIPTAYLQAGC